MRSDLHVLGSFEGPKRVVTESSIVVLEALLKIQLGDVGDLAFVACLSSDFDFETHLQRRG